LAIMKNGMALTISVRKWPAFRDAFQKRTHTHKTDTPTNTTDTHTKYTDTPTNYEGALLYFCSIT
jgi:hypothetical protein